MKAAILEMLSSKKALAALISAVAYALGHWGLHLDEQGLITALAPLQVYILGQAVADHGKSAEKIAQGGS